MKNQELSALFGRVADLLEIKGENRFRINAYRKIAQVLADLTEDIAAVTTAGRLEQLDGIGKTGSLNIREWLATGRLPVLEEAQEGMAPGIAELLAVSGLGPKTAAMLHKELGVGGLDDLRSALAAGKLTGLPGIGPKKADNIRKGLEELLALRASGAGSRTLLGVALHTAEPIGDWLRAQPGALRVEAAGSLRRRRETIGDMDFLVAAEPAHAPAILAGFAKMPMAASVLGQGGTKASIKTVGGLQVDLRVVPPDCWGAALLYFTGSKEHNVRLRERAITRGWKLSEYGLFEGETRLAAATEEEIYARLGLAWVPPELREDRGELEAAEAGTLPTLLTAGDICGDLHMHTTASDGANSIVEMAEAARRLGYQYIAITDHSQSLGVARGLSPERLVGHIADIRAAQEKVPGIRLLAGTESDILEDGGLDYDDALLAQLDLVIGSLHGQMKMSTEAMTARLVKAVSHPRLHVLGHPTARIIHRRAPVEADWDAVIAAARAHGKAMELNANTERLDLSDVMARKAAAAGVPMMIDTDAHGVGELSQMRLGVATARRAWLRKSDVVNTRSLPEMLTWLRRER